MTRQYELVEKVAAYNPRTDEALLNRAYVYAMQAHKSQTRASGDPYITHPIEVASILAGLHLDDSTIAAALLHDTVEDTNATHPEINEIFGAEISNLVEGLTKLNKLDLVSKRAQQAENFRKLLLSISKDIRVLLIKLADRLHNMRTLEHVPEEKRARISRETMDIYAPLAGRMGMQEMRGELEDLSFQYLSPDAYLMIQKRLKMVHEENRGLIDEIVDALTKRLAATGISAQVKGREKRPYSIWRKMEQKSVSFEQLSDIYGFRIIVETEEECYRALGIVHREWPMVPGRFKDYISTPKRNDYCSIHTTVIGPRHQRVELQIRTSDMDDVAEHGIAVHALYKDFGDGEENGHGRGKTRKRVISLRETNAYQWLARLLEMLEEGDNPEEFLEHTKLELFLDQVFCFTPKGRLIALPVGAKPIDFAYAVHTDVGNTCVGCKVNGKMRPLSQELESGDEVEIVCSDTQTPPPAWAEIAVTGKARAAIRRETRAAARSQYASLGRQIVQRAFERADKSYSDESVEAVLTRLAFGHVEDVLMAVGRGDMASGDVVQAVYPDYQELRPTVPESSRFEDGWFGIRKAIGLKFRIPGRNRTGSDKKKNGAADPSIPIRGLRGKLPVEFSKTGAVPGDRIVGILEPGKGITIYPIASPALRDFDDQPDRWLDVRWEIDTETPERFPARIKITAINEPGSLAQIATVIGEHDGNIDGIEIVGRTHDFKEMQIDLEVWDIKHLNGIISQLRKNKSVSSAGRIIS